MEEKQTTDREYRELLAQRLLPRNPNLLDVRTSLQHFALINYAVPAKLLAKQIADDRFAIPEFRIGGKLMGLISAVPFIDTDFRFHRLFPWVRFHFPQTNHRAYVIDKRTGQHGVWFFGTTLGSPVVHFASILWRIPWHFAKYRVDCTYHESKHRYLSYRMQIKSAWCDANINIWDSGEAVAVQEGFRSMDEMRLILTHPVDGFFRRRDGIAGRYSIWHAKMALTMGQSSELYFSLYERLGLLSRFEMQHPHSILMCPKVDFDIFLPPVKDLEMIPKEVEP